MLILTPSPWFWTAACLAVIGGACVLLFVRRIVPVGAAYKAKVLCSAIFVGGRDLDPDTVEDVSEDSYRIMRLFGARVDREKKTVTASFFGWGARTAVYRPGFGATLAIGVSPEDLAPKALVSEPLKKAPWTVTLDKELQRVAEEAFTEPNPKRLRRTRAVVVVRDGKIVAESYAPGFDRDSRLCGWSMSKSVLGLLVGVLVGEKKLSLEQNKLLPEWSAPQDPRGGITLDDMLRMRSGLEFAEIYSNPLEDVTQMLFARGDAAAFAASEALCAPPGAVWSYSSGTTNILSRVLRNACEDDETYWKLPRRALFDPLGMESALIEPDAAGDFVFSSFMYASARDWARLGRLCLQDGVWEGKRILPEGWIVYGVQPTPQAPGGIYGAHWWLKLQPEMGGGTSTAARIPGDAFFAIGHEGQAVTVIPSKNLVVVRLGMAIHIDAWNHADFMARVLDVL